MARATRYDEVAPVILERISAAEARHAKAPSVRELAEHCDVAVATMHSYLAKLAGTVDAAGAEVDPALIEWKTGRHRSLRLTDRGRGEVAVPHIFVA